MQFPKACLCLASTPFHLCWAHTSWVGHSWVHTIGRMHPNYSAPREEKQKPIFEVFVNLLRHGTG